VNHRLLLCKWIIEAYRFVEVVGMAAADECPLVEKRSHYCYYLMVIFHHFVIVEDASRSERHLHY